jgi:hypothetical protein
MEILDLGNPVAYTVLRDGVPVYDPDGERIGVVEHVLADEISDIFEGLVIHTHPLPGTHRLAMPEQIQGMYERGVRLSVGRDELFEPTAEAEHRHHYDGGPPFEERIERALRRAWDRIAGRSS